jgi:hypothetical protein
MSNTNTGGSAFPFVDYDCHGDIMDIHSGMTLRDYFAAKAMQAILQANKGIYFTPPDTDLSASAYEMADAMLKARQA